MRYPVVFKKTKTGYSAFSPDSPGRAATGGDKKEVELNMKDAIEFHIAGLQAENMKVPKSTSFSTCLEVTA